MAYPQSGITNRPQGHLLLVALAFEGDRAPTTTRATLEDLRTLVHRELTSNLDDQGAATPKGVPGPETGELGFDDGYNRDFLTITLGVSSAGFAALGVPAVERPADLVPIPWAALGDNPELADDGDLLLQICSDNIYINEHVARRVEEDLGGRLRVAWTQAGVQRFTSRAGRVSRREGRALIGFHDGTSNLHPRHEEADAGLVFVDPKRVGEYPPHPAPQAGGYPGQGPNFPADLRPVPISEPEWTKGGTYMAVRVSVNNVTAWDDLPLGEQEQAIGRFKWSGASLDLADDPAHLDNPPAFAANQGDTRVALAAHTRKANPRREAADQARRIFRRGYALIQPGPGELRRGLVFICFGRTLATQFEFIVRAWMNNPDFPMPGTGVDRLQAFDRQVLCGGYYFVPPLARKAQPWSWVIPPTTGPA